MLCGFDNYLKGHNSLRILDYSIVRNTIYWEIRYIEDTLVTLLYILRFLPNQAILSFGGRNILKRNFKVSRHAVGCTRKSEKVLIWNSSPSGGPILAGSKWWIMVIGCQCWDIFTTFWNTWPLWSFWDHLFEKDFSPIQNSLSKWTKHKTITRKGDPSAQFLWISDTHDKKFVEPKN